MTTHYVYRAKDPEGCVLYVGFTSNPAQRMKTHLMGAVWKELVALPFDWVKFETKGDAMDFERAEIERLRPKYNRGLNPDVRGFPQEITPVSVNLIVERSTRDAWKLAALDNGLTLQRLITKSMDAYLLKRLETTP